MTGKDIAAVRDELAADDALVGRELCRTWTAAVDAWLAGLLEVAAAGDRSPDAGVPAAGSGSDRGAPVNRASTGGLATGRGMSSPGVALVAVGGYGRGELSLQSDLDVMLLHAGIADIAALADRVWYPVWDQGVKLGHAVRTVREALAVAAQDLEVATSLLSLRHLAGDQALTEQLAHRSRLQWHKRARRWLTALAQGVRARHGRAGEVAFLLEPDLKDGRGGLRDVQALRWARDAQAVVWDLDEAAIAAAYDMLLAVRVELHRRTGRPGDRLLLQDQDELARALGHGQADDLMREVAAAARTIAWTSDDAWARIESSLAGPLGRARRDRALGPGLVLRDGEVHVRDDVDVAGDPAVALRAAAAAAQRGTQLDRRTLARLADEASAPPDPWPDEVRSALVELLLAGRPALLLLEALDQQGVWQRYLPEWSTVRSRPQRNAYHRYTVDRHLWETAVYAASLADRVRRPDLLILGALLHDLGKGRPGDHVEIGARLAADVGRRAGLDRGDTATLVALCRHHLLLPDLATRRDLDDPATVEAVVGAVGTLDTLELLAALTEADGCATGPAAWSEWKAGLVRRLVDRVARALGGVDGSPTPAGTGDVPPAPTDRAEPVARTGVDVPAAETVHLGRAGRASDVAGRITAGGDGRNSEGRAALAPTGVDAAATTGTPGGTAPADVAVARADAPAEPVATSGAGPVQASELWASTAAERALLDAGRTRILTDQDRVTVVTPERRGLFSRIAGVLALNGLAVRDARVLVEGGAALHTFGVESSFGPMFAWDPTVADLERALAGRLAVSARLADRARMYGWRTDRTVVDDEPQVRFDRSVAADATVVEVHAADGVGLLHRVTRAFDDLDLAIVRALVQTLGPRVVDSFYVRGHDGRAVTEPAVLDEIERAVLHALAAPT